MPLLILETMDATMLTIFELKKDLHRFEILWGIVLF